MENFNTQIQEWREAEAEISYVQLWRQRNSDQRGAGNRSTQKL